MAPTFLVGAAILLHPQKTVRSTSIDIVKELRLWTTTIASIGIHLESDAMADEDLTENDRPRDRVAELVGTLRAMGLSPVADLITNDIEWRRRVHARRKEKPELEGDGAEESAQFDDIGSDYPVVVDDKDSSLQDSEQVAVAIRALELLVINPTRMAEEIAWTSIAISKKQNDGDSKDDQLQQAIPLLQLSLDRALIPWTNSNAIAATQAFTEALPKLEMWLRGAAEAQEK